MKMNKNNYKQYDTRWASMGYPKKPYYIKNCGCGEVAICNCIIEMEKHKSQTPKTIQPYCVQFAEPHGNGTYFSGIPKMMKHYGMTEVKEHATMDSLWKELAKGDRVAIYLMGNRKGGSKGVHWTSSAHFVCSVAYKLSGKKHMVYVKDSNSTSSLRNGWISYEENMRNDVSRVWSGKLPTTVKPTKSVDEIAKEVLDGKWGNGVDRIIKLQDAGYDPVAVQTRVNELLSPKKSIEELANEVINGEWGSGDDRKKRLTDAGYDYDAVQKKVNEIIASKTSWIDKANAWAKKIANDNSYHYVKWTSKDTKTHQCPICNNFPNGKYHGWNCIGFTYAIWHHGGGLKCKCNDGVISNGTAEKMLKMSEKDALAEARKRIGLNDLKVIINKNGIPKSQWKAGDICMHFNGSEYVHNYYYMGDGKIAESTGLSGKVPNDNQIRIKKYDSKKAKIIIRYIGK